ncbi:hypothetical protein TNIN_341951 [Trichonephila inaurata madagascariensis]|uniref:Uncharacterized protein n=1 Tax=Trichonephila inaurata madagascariensis TaxID=2747483 RepID=A0A8X7CA94_9ARAC|nr:hypothetical protein TNIN_341951 [Trichonephila inaurata madagascariensis]
MELNNDHHSDMEMTHSAFGTSSRSSTPSMTNYDRLQIANAELRKFSILHSNVSHAIESAAPFAQDDDLDMADLYTRQAYLEHRRLQAVRDFNTLPRCNTPGCHIHSAPLNSPSKCVNDDFPELPKKSKARKEDLRLLAEEPNLNVGYNMKIPDLSKLITTHPDYDEEFSKNLLTIIVEDRKLREQEMVRKQRELVREQQEFEKEGKA